MGGLSFTAADVTEQALRLRHGTHPKGDRGRIAELEAELAHRKHWSDIWQFETERRGRLSAGWEHLPGVAAPQPRDHSALFRAIRKGSK